MSDVSKQMIICSHCHRTSFFNIWSSINTKTNPATYNQVRSLSLFTFRCPYCDRTELIRYAFLYHQMENSLMIYYQPEEDAIAETKKMFEEINGDVSGGNASEDGSNDIPSAQQLLENVLAGYCYRIVRTHEEFLEKLAVFDAGLDDRLVEITKVIVGAQAERKLSEYGFRVKNARFLYDRESHEMKIVFFDKNSSQTATTAFDRHIANIYNQAIDRYSQALLGTQKRDMLIDWNWASDFLKNATQ